MYALPFAIPTEGADSVSVHKHANKEFGHYPGIFTLRLVNNPHMWHLNMEYQAHIGYELVLYIQLRKKDP